MYDEAIEALVNNNPELALIIINRVMKEDGSFIVQISNHTQENQEELEFDHSIDFIPSNGWEAA